MDRSILDLPFYGPEHRQLSDAIFDWASNAMPEIDHHDTDNACRKLVAALGKAGFLRYAVPAAYGGALDELDSRSLCIARETLAYHDGLADFAFAMQGLGTGAITLSGSEALKQHVLPKVASGEWISAFVVYPDMPGFEVAERMEVIAPHPLARLRFTDMKVPVANRLGAPGEGFKVAMRTLDIFRSSVAAAALGFARRALDEGLSHAKARPMFGHTLADFQLTQARLGEMATDIEAAALLTARAAWRRDVQKLPTTREAAMAKMTATENAQRVIDAAVQMHGGQGVRVGVKVESLYREIRALRIYEGATEVQKLIVARELLK